jgi:hypothetical protein
MLYFKNNQVQGLNLLQEALLQAHIRTPMEAMKVTTSCLYIKMILQSLKSALKGMKQPHIKGIDDRLEVQFLMSQNQEKE